MHYKIIESLVVVGTLHSGVARMSKLCGDSVHTFSACVTLCLLGELGHAPAMKIFLHSQISSAAVFATNTILSVLPVCSLHVHMEAIAHANDWLLTLAFYIIFTWAPVNLHGHRPGMPSCSHWLHVP